jgi:ribosomal-protein-alanine N-acetyltransferase
MIRVRPATAEDLAAILAIERDASTAAHWNEKEYQRALKPDGLLQRVLLVVEETAVLGFVMARTLGDEWELENVVVAGEQRRRGLASRLFEELISQARRRNAASLYLEVRESNIAGRKLYERWGLAEVGRRKSYYSNPVEDAILYRLVFPQLPRIPVEGPLERC